MAAKQRRRSDTLQYLWGRLIGEDPDRVADYERIGADIEVGRAIYKLRADAGWTQRQLARKLGTTASVICRLEDTDYEGHSLSMLRHIAAALGKRVEIRFVPAGTGKPPRRGKAA